MGVALRQLRESRFAGPAILAALIAVAIVLAVAGMTKPVANAFPGAEASSRDLRGDRADLLATFTDTPAAIEITWPIEMTRDPFAWDAVFAAPARASRQKPEPAPKSPADALSLEAIIFDESPRAIINGRVVRPGESIEGFRIMSIERRSIIVERDGDVLRIEL